MTMLPFLSDVIKSGLKRKSVVSCSDWAIKYRKMGKPYPGPFSFKHHPWLKEMHDAKEELIVGMKGAQVGFTEWALNTVLFYIDIHRIDCLYVLPSKTPDASDFSASRFDGALELSDHLSKLFSNVKNVGHKRAGSTNLYIRGSHSRSSLKSIPSGLIVFDEVEEMEEANINLGLERQSGQIFKKVLLISTPRIANRGIHAHYSKTTQEHFMFRCPHCSIYTELIFPECLVITADSINDPRINDTHLICKECKHLLSHENKFEWLSNGKWVPSFPNRVSYGRGFHINQLYSSTETPINIAKLYLRSQYDKTAEQEFYNSKLGLVHEVKGARINDTMIDNCIGTFTQKDFTKGNKIVTMGIDQGIKIHYEIAEWTPINLNNINFNPGNDINDYFIPRIAKVGEVDEFDQLDELMKHYRILATVIDAQPERREALRFANRFPGFVYLCYYGEGVSGKTLNQWSNEPVITVDRTSWMDQSLGRFKFVGNSTDGSKLIILPMDIPLEYRQHIKAPVRTYAIDRYGNPYGQYVCDDNTPDHFAHARTYNEIALTFAGRLHTSSNIIN